MVILFVLFFVERTGSTGVVASVAGIGLMVLGAAIADGTPFTTISTRSRTASIADAGPWGESLSDRFKVTPFPLGVEAVRKTARCDRCRKSSSRSPVSTIVTRVG
jgi:hypothetical protein